MQDLSTSDTSDPSNGVDRPLPSSTPDPDDSALSQRFQNYYSFSAQPYRNPQPSNFPCRRTVLVIMLSFIIIISAPLFVIWLIRSPSFPEVRVDSFHVTNLSTSTHSITGAWHLNLVFSNDHNKMTATYYHVHVSIFYQSEYLTETLVSPFKETQGDEVNIHVTLSLVSSYVDEWIVDTLTEDTAGGKVRFDIKVLAKIDFKEGGWRTRTKWLRVSCSNIPVHFSDNNTSGSLVDGAVYCED